MSIHSIDFTGEPVPTGAPVETPLQAAHAIANGFIPDNLLKFSSLSDSFRDATIAELLVLSASNNKFEDVLGTLAKAVRSAGEGTVVLKLYSEYMAAIAFAWEHQELAGKVIMRNKPQDVSPFLWVIVSAIKKNMPSAMFASLMMSQGEQANQKWAIEATTMFGISVTPQAATI